MQCVPDYNAYVCLISRAPPCFRRRSASHALGYVLPVICRRLTTGIPVIHIFQCSCPNPSPDQLLHALPFHNPLRPQPGRSKPHARQLLATTATVPRQRAHCGMASSPKWPWLPTASTRSLRDGWEAHGWLPEPPRRVGLGGP